jgi:beta-galactosidase
MQDSARREAKLPPAATKVSIGRKTFPPHAPPESGAVRLHQKDIQMRSYTILLVPPLLLASAVRAEHRTPLSESWQLQPAGRADITTVGDKWTEGSNAPWSWKGPLRRPKFWSDLDVNTVHSLWYKQTLTIPAPPEGHRFLLDFHRIEGDAIVFLNGRRIGELLRPGGEVEISDAICPGPEQELLVFLTRDYTGISRGFEEDPLRYRTRGPKGRNLPTVRWGLGISAPVELIVRPKPAAIAGTFARPSWRGRRLEVDVDIETSEAVPNTHLELIVADADGTAVLTTTGAPMSLPAGRTTRTVTAPWENPIPWELEAPYLYTLAVRLHGPDGVLDGLAGQRFGFREIWTKGRDVFLNGHVSRWRMEWTAFGVNANSVSLLRLLGRNVLYAQNNPTAWWCDWTETPYYRAELLELLDQTGIGLLLPVPSISGIRDLLLHDERARADFQREMALWVRRYRNHPSILAWSVSMNSFNPRAAVHPETMGQRVDYSHHQARAIEDAVAMAKANDPTRLAYGHADGNLADLATANVYPNFAPLQEVEDWPEIWATKGDMPFIAAEYALPYGGSFYNKTQFLGTEFAAMYFGNEAYHQEPDALLRKTVDIGLGNRGHGNSLAKAVPDFPMYWALRSLYVTHSDRAWRTWGVLAWHYFNFGIGYGDPPGYTGNRFNRYAAMRKPVTGRPDWANPNYDMHGTAMQPLLAYIGGHPVFTDKTHAYHAGEDMIKQTVLLWDGPGRPGVDVAWRLRQGEVILARGRSSLTPEAGDRFFLPIECRAPSVLTRTELTLEMSVFEDGEIAASDTFPIQVFPRPESPNLDTRVAIWDPQGKTAAELSKLGFRATTIVPGVRLADYDVLLVGREALTPGAQLPWTPNDISRGLQVIVFAQQPEMWEALGFLPDDLMTRRIFPTVTDHPVLDGLETVDLRDWRGSPDLLPAFKRRYGHDGPRAPRSSNRGTVASVVLRLPDAIGFTPILNCEFDLDYSPLLQWQHGKGMVLFCTLDLTSRLGNDPVAIRLVTNLLRFAAADRPIAPPVTVVRPEDAFDDAATIAATRSGQRVVVLPRPADELKAAGFSLESKRLVRATNPAGKLFTSIGPRLLRWRDAIAVNAFSSDGQPDGCTVHSDGLFLIQKLGKGERLFVQAGPELLARRYADDSGRRAAVQLSVFRLRQLTAQLLTNAGVPTDPAVAARLCELRAGPAYERLGAWHVLGPHYTGETNPAKILASPFAGEENAIAGDTNPNLTYTTTDARTLDFRTIVTARSDGFIDLTAPLKPTAQAVAYVTRTVSSRMERDAILRLGVDYFMQVWVNGDIVYCMAEGHGSPKPNRHEVKVHLRPGENVFTIKILAGSKGFGFWANLSTGNTPEETAERATAVSLYPPHARFFDPYEYHYW